MAVVVVVDGDREHADLLGLLFRQLGYSVCVAYDEHEGLREIERRQPEIVFLDLDMPRFDGHALARRLAAKRGNERPRLVALTADRSNDALDKATDAGFDHLVAKPAELHLLLSLFNSPWRPSQQ